MTAGIASSFQISERVGSRGSVIDSDSLRIAIIRPPLAAFPNPNRAFLASCLVSTVATSAKGVVAGGMMGLFWGIQ
jgi:hypothetical protein